MNRFVIGDPKDCIGCNTCMAACSEVHKAFGFVIVMIHHVLPCVRCTQSPILMTPFNLMKVSVSVVNFVVLLAHLAQLLSMVLHRLMHLPIMKDSPSLMR